MNELHVNLSKIALIFALGFSQIVLANSRNQFIQQNWGEEQGLPVGDINGMVQDSIGYIWIASLEGLLRFDGVEFNQYDTANSHLPSNLLTTIRLSVGNVLWLSSEEGELIRFSNSIAKTMSKKEGMPHARITCVTPRGDKNIAYGTINGVVLIQGENTIGLPLSKISGNVNAINWHKKSSLWVATNSWLYHVKNPLKNPTVNRWRINQKVITLAIQNNDVWIGTNNGLFRFNGKSLIKQFPKTIKLEVDNIRLMPTNELLINSNKLWRLSNNQLFQVSDFNQKGFWKPLFVANKYNQIFYQGQKNLWFNGNIIASFDSDIHDLIQEKSGDILIATNKHGIVHLKHNNVKNIGMPEGLPFENVYPIFQKDDQSILIADNNKGVILLDEMGQYQSTIKDIYKGKVISINPVNNSLWLVGEGVCMLNQQNQCQNISSPQLDPFAPFSLVYQDKKENIWLAGRLGTLLVKAPNKSWQQITNSQNNWKVTTRVQTVIELANGDLMFGTNGDGIIRVRDNKVIDDSGNWGLASGSVRSLLLINQQYLMVGTQDKGLCRVDLSNKVSTCLNKQNNLISISIHFLHRDKEERIWWSSNRGIYWQKLSVLLDVFDGKYQNLPYGGRYDKNNGMRNSEANGRAFPAGFVDKNDKLWIPTQQGLAIFDTNETTVIPNTDAIIQTVLLDGKELKFHNNLTLKAKQRTFQVKLTALSFYDPKNIEFRYRQTNQQNDTTNNWINILHNRLVNFNHLPSGTHQLEFQARNSGGEWQKSPTLFKVNIKPYWYETLLFKIFVLIIAMVLVTSYIKWRNEKLVKRTKMLEKMVKDSTFELKQMGEKRIEFFANISHELRTPLTLIYGPIDDAIIQQKDLKLKDLKLLHHSTQSMKRLVDQMLDLQKLDAEKLNLKKSQQHLLTFLNACIEPFQILAHQMEISLYINQQSVDKCVNIGVNLDTEQMEKVIGNLLSNAFKFSTKGNKIEIKLETFTDIIAIKVLDDGPGIPAGATERIFNRFSQESNSKYTTHQGTGIGLALVKEIIELHGGQIRAENRNIGGACFTMTLPAGIIQDTNKSTTMLSRYENELLESQYSHAKDKMINNKKNKKADNTSCVLIVEDNKDLQKYIATHLEQQFQLIFADDGEQGLKMAQSHLPDIIVSDVMMPNMDGFEMAKALRQDITTNFIPFLFLTAKITAEDEMQGLSLGADDYISKPFSGVLLIARIQSIFDSRKRLQISLQQNQHFIKNLSQSDSLKTKAVNAIYQNISDHKFNVDALAKCLFMSRSKLHRQLKAKHETTPLILMRQIRMKEADKLLSHGQGNVSEVCCAVGYNNLSSFSQIFKETFGISPSAQVKKSS